MQRDLTGDLLDSLDRRIHRLELQRNALLGLMAVFVTLLVGAWCVSRMEKLHSEFRVDWAQTGEIRFASSSDGPFVVTHLVRYGHNEGEKAVATLPHALAIVDSAGAHIPAEKVAKFKWVGIRGQTVKSPPPGAEINALYYRPERAIPHKPHE